MTSACATYEIEPTYILPEGLDSLLDDVDCSLVEAVPCETPEILSPEGSSPVELVDESAAQRQDAPGASLRSRLLAAAWVIFLGLAALFLRQLAFVSDPIHPWLTGAMLIVSVGGLTLLAGPRVLTEEHLRTIELSLFSTAGVLLIAYQTGWMFRAAFHGDAVLLISTLDTAVLGFVVLMLCYGMFMPNSWRRTALMLIPPAHAPIGVAAVVCSVHPFAREAVPSGRIAELAAVLAICVGIAAFGAKTISTLRQEARRARRLGQYRLQKLIGRGGMGDVYLAEHQLLKRPCAVKVIRPRQMTDPLSLVRFEREVRSMARLSHWNTVEVFDYGHADDGTFYYVMEYLPGLNLADLVQRTGPLPPPRVIHFLKQACAALMEAHQMGIVHRDLKPANIFASHRGGEYDVTKLLDFGLVNDNQHAEWVAAEAEGTATFAGSPSYTSPEQARGEQHVDLRSDLYSLGAVGYFLLTGHPPFERPTPLQLILAHARDPVTPPSFWRAGVPEDLEGVLLRCLEKDPAQRYESAAKLRQALFDCADGRRWTHADSDQWWNEHTSELEALWAAAEPIEFG
jgi:tRNA A-37 threonylcarbamoyl transferase component Bud32